MSYCKKCGRKLNPDDSFCPGCGNRVEAPAAQQANSGARQTAQSAQQANSGARQTAQSAQQANSGTRQTAQSAQQANSGTRRTAQSAQQANSGARQTAQSAQQANSGARQTAQSAQQAGAQSQPDGSRVQYVYVDKKTGRIRRDPRVKSGSEGCAQYLAVSLAAVAVVILMVAGSFFLSLYLGGSLSGSSDIVDSRESDEALSGEESSGPESSEPVSSQTVSSQPVSSEPQIPEELTAVYLQKKLKGKWRTDVPYKSMKLPAIFEFDGVGKCKCTVKALFLSKKFEGTYTVKDGGKCTITLNGLGEYFDGDTMNGSLKFTSDDTLEFTVDKTVWKLTREK